MSAKLPPNASVASPQAGSKLSAPAATRNSGYICDLLKRHAPHSGNALEIASGTGQHVMAFAQALPDLLWQPTEVADERLASIDAYRADVPKAKIKPAQYLDATQTGWHGDVPAQDCIVLINLLHLISTPQTETLIHEAVAALAPAGKFILYGPFKRSGHLTSEGDARFDADLRGAEPDIGYKNDDDIEAWLLAAGACEVSRVEMPANNLAFIATR